MMMCSYICPIILLCTTAFFLCNEEIKQILLLGYAEHDSHTAFDSQDGLEFWEFETAN